jgi:uncharacterized SAM-binding protein YcdF (DUF218 family)
VAEPISYPKGVSRVFYIGRAEGYVGRGFESMGDRLVRSLRGEFEGLNNPPQVAAIYTITATGKTSATPLESALMTAFRMAYGRKPKANGRDEGFADEHAYSFQLQTGIDVPQLVELLKSLG